MNQNFPSMGQTGPMPVLPMMGGPPPPPIVPQLPPQMFTTAAQLLDLTDKKLLAVLRDGRRYIGVLRSWDQFGNIVLQDTIERIFGGTLFAEVKRGLFVVRGENVMLLGEIDLDKEDDIPAGYKEGDVDAVYALYKQEMDDRRSKDKGRAKSMKTFGFVDGDGADAA